MLCYCVVGRISSYVCACSMSSLLHSGMSHASTCYAWLIGSASGGHRVGAVACLLVGGEDGAIHLILTNSTISNPINPN